MMDPLLTVPPSLTPSAIPSSVVNLVNGCKPSSGHGGHASSEIFKDDPITTRENIGVTTDDLKSLLEFFAKTTYKAKDTHPKVQHVMARCQHLFGIDYNYSILSNTSGELSANYPSNLIILESDKVPLSPSRSPTKPRVIGDSNCGLYSSCSHSAAMSSNVKIGLSSSWRLHSNSTNQLQESNGELPKLKDLCSRARFARCRARFPVPVILYNQKHICRSATLSGGPEIYGRSSFDYLFSGIALDPEPGGDDDVLFADAQSQSDWQLFDRVRSQDIRLLKTFQVETIVDLMVEKKKVKFGVNVTSSEKVDKENRYAEFNIVSLPYPGCEFFKQYRDNGYVAEELVFEWNQGHVDANICVPSDPTAASLNLDWSHYRDWDLVVLSQNYLKLLLGYLRDRDSGLLIHCISGWDRTPLFVSLLRLSLWADGAIHKSLDADQILYLTLAYDWLLFGHNLEDRLSKGEEILFFCFNFLKYIVDPQFSINRPSSEVPKAYLSKVRNDSDVHLDGVLLDHEGCQTSPEGSNWSLNSYGSVKSTRSQEPPPNCFGVSNDSWEECVLAPNQPAYLNNKSQNGSNHSLVQLLSHPKLTTNGAFTGSCLITASMINSTTAPIPAEITIGGGGFSKSQSPNRCILESALSTQGVMSSTPKSILPEILLQHGSSNGTDSLECGSPHGRTSPVAVPVPNRLHLSHSTRHDSTSSASIGSWQLINGTGSLRENIFVGVSSGSCSSHSHPSRLSANLELDCIESSVSSCTLVEDLTPIESKPPFELSLLSHLEESLDATVNQGMRCFDGLGLAAFQDSLKLKSDQTPIGISHPNTLDLTTSSSREDELVVTASTSTTPTKEQENEDIDVVDGGSNGDHHVFTNPTTTEVNPELSRRLERLDKVRSRFYSLYDTSIRTNRNLSESYGSSGSGLGFLIGNIATKVGIRTAAHRTTHV